MQSCGWGRNQAAQNLLRPGLRLSHLRFLPRKCSAICSGWTSRTGRRHAAVRRRWRHRVRHCCEPGSCLSIPIPRPACRSVRSRDCLRAHYAEPSRCGNNIVNGLTNVGLFECAASDRAGQAVLRLVENNPSTQAWCGIATTLEQRNLPYAPSAFDDLLDAGHLSPPRFIKIDVEGAAALLLGLAPQPRRGEAGGLHRVLRSRSRTLLAFAFRAELPLLIGQSLGSR